MQIGRDDKSFDGRKYAGLSWNDFHLLEYVYSTTLVDPSPSALVGV